MRSSRRSRPRATRRTNGAPDLFEGRFSEILIIFVLALIVLGPEKLPRVVSEVGRWVGRARSMARQFREQLEEEVQLEEARKAQAAQRAAAPAPADPSPPPVEAPPLVEPPTPPAEPPLAPTFSHTHPTDATGAEPAAGTGHASAQDERT